MSSIINKYKERKIFYTSIIVLILIFISSKYIFNSFSMLQPVKSITITSNNVSYANQDKGSWNITKSAKWTSEGKARITFDVDTIAKTPDDKYTDIIMVLDISGSMYGDKLNRVKTDSIELINFILSESNNKVGLITFESSSTLVSNLTNDKNSLIDQINTLNSNGNTNYYRALENVDNILKTYTKENNRECIVLFLTDGYPNTETPNEVGEYSYLKDTYPYITVNGVQYEMGDAILDPIKKVSDNQFIADMDSLNNVLFDASVSPEPYENFTITDYIDTNYFNISSIDNITTSIGESSLDGNKVTWNINNFRSGSKATMTIDVTLKSEYLNVGGTYPTNTKTDVTTKITGNNENLTTTNTPILQDNYVVMYDGNSPTGCTVSNVPDNETKKVFETVKISETKPTCIGYIFKGWKVVTDNVTKVNDDYFIMPEEDVTVRAEWSKLSLTKSVDGKVAKVQTLYNVMKDQAVMDNIQSEYVSSSTGIDFTQNNSDTNGKGVYKRAGTENDTYPIYYYRGDVNDNNVIFAGYCWKMVRTTDTGGIKMIYNGVPTDGKCNNTGTNTQIGTKEFNWNYTSPADVGYMYGTRYVYSSVTSSDLYYAPDVTYSGGTYTLTSKGSYNVEKKSDIRGSNLKYHHYTCGSSTGTTCASVKYVYYVDGSIARCITLTGGKKIEDALSDMLDNNTTSSTIKGSSTTEGTIDYWYYNNINNKNDSNGNSYSTYLEDAVYCNDRSFNNYTESGWNPDGGSTNDYLYFGSYGRKRRNNPSVTCPRAIDKFTVSNSIGNGKLDYPVGLLTVDEIRMSGGTVSNNSSYYLYTGKDWVSSSPGKLIHYGSSSVWCVGSNNGYLIDQDVYHTRGVRPVVSLKSGIRTSGGDGTKDDPYIVEVRE